MLENTPSSDTLFFLLIENVVEFKQRYVISTSLLIWYDKFEFKKFN